MEKAVFQFTVSLNLRKDSIAETLPPPSGNEEGSSNKQLELPVNIQVLDSLFFDSQCCWGILECNPTLCHQL